VNLVSFALVCLAAAALGNAIVVPIEPGALPAFWPLSGALIGTLVTSERSRWPAMAIIATGAMLAGDLTLGRPFTQSLLLAAIFGVEATVAALVLNRTAGRFSLTRVSHVWALVLVAALAPIVGGAAAAFTFAGASWLPAWRAWWLMETSGVVLMAPLAVAAATERAHIAHVLRSRGAETAIVLTAGVATAVVVFGGALSPLVQVPAYLLPFFLWSVFRLGVAGTALTVLLLSFTGLWFTAMGQGPLALPGATLQQWVLRSQGSLVIAGASFLLMAATVADRRRVAAENQGLVEELRKALAEIKTLEGLIPICAWCHKVRDDEGFWQQIEKYIDARTDATFSHGICPTCAEQAHLEVHKGPGWLSQ
jgi:integral membrane sensor domain MASE1